MNETDAFRRAQQKAQRRKRRKRDGNTSPEPTFNPVGTEPDYSRLGIALSRSALDDLPEPEPLIEGVLDRASTVMLIGQQGTHKTFAALGWVGSVATGTAWLGEHEPTTTRGSAIYVVAEGMSGLKNRFAAWEEAAGVKISDECLEVRIRPDSLNDEATWTQLRDLAEQRRADLIVLDTMSSLAPDLRETEDSARITRYMANLASESGACVVMVHHTGWSDKTRARGGSQLEANVDSVWVFELARPDDPGCQEFTATRKKNKDGAAGQRIGLRRVDRGASAVLELVDVPTGTRAPHGRLREEILRVLDDFEEFTLTRTELLEKVSGRKGSRREALEGLIADGLVREKRCRPPDRSGREAARLAGRVIEVVAKPPRSRGGKGGEQ